MRRYLAYLIYVLRHKWFVVVECVKLGIPLRGIMHDMDKFNPNEFIPYANFFYNKDGSKRQIRDKIANDDFDFAWFLHQKKNKHHWQWWIIPKDSFGESILEMDDASIKEMVADWRGAGRAQGTAGAVKWYLENKDKLRLHWKTRKRVENILGIKDGEKTIINT